MSRICLSCGKSLRENAKFCNSCGTQHIENSLAESAVNQSEVDKPYSRDYRFVEGEPSPDVFDTESSYDYLYPLGLTKPKFFGLILVSILISVWVGYFVWTKFSMSGVSLLGGTSENSSYELNGDQVHKFVVADANVRDRPSASGTRIVSKMMRG